MILHHCSRPLFIAEIDHGVISAREYALDVRFSLACDAFCESVNPCLMEDARFAQQTGENRTLLGRIWMAGDFATNVANNVGRLGPYDRHVRFLAEHLAALIHAEKDLADQNGRDRFWYSCTVTKCTVDDLDKALGNVNAFSHIGAMRSFVKYECSDRTSNATVVCFEGRTWPCDVAWTMNVVAGESGIPEHKLAHLVACEGVPYLVCAPGALEIIAQSTACVALRRGLFKDCTLVYPLVFALITAGWDVCKDKNCPGWTRLLRATMTWLIRASRVDSSPMNPYGDVESQEVLEPDENQSMNTYSLIGQLVALVAQISRNHGLYKGRSFLHALLRLRTPCVFTWQAVSALQKDLEDVRRTSPLGGLRTTVKATMRKVPNGSTVSPASGCSEDMIVVHNTSLWCFVLNASMDVNTELFNGVTTGYSPSATSQKGVLIRKTLKPENPLAPVDDVRFSDLANELAEMYKGGSGNDGDMVDTNEISDRNKCAHDMLWFLRGMELMMNGKNEDDASSCAEDTLSPNVIFSLASQGHIIAYTRPCIGAHSTAFNTFLLADYPLSEPSNGITCSGCNRTECILRSFGNTPQSLVLPLKSEEIMDALIVNRFGLPRVAEPTNVPSKRAAEYGANIERTTARSRRDIVNPSPVDKDFEMRLACNEFGNMVPSMQFTSDQLSELRHTLSTVV